MLPQTDPTEASSDDGAPGRSQPVGRLAARLAALQAANFAGIGIYMPFIPPWLAAQGLSERQIGFVLAMGMIIRMLASQPITALGDGRHGAVRVLVALHVLGGLSFLALTIMPSPAALIATMAVVALMSAGVVPLGDHLTTAQVRAHPSLDFSRIRLWGSVAFLVMSTASGFAVEHFGIGSVPYMLAFCSFGAMLVALAAPRRVAGGRLRAEQEFGAIGTGMRSRLLWLCIIASSLISGSHAALYGFGTLYWRSLGIDDTMIGALWASAVVAEIAIFWWFGRRAASNWNTALLFLGLSGVAAIVRFALMPFGVSLPAILALQMLHALSFGAQLMGIMAIIAMLAPEGRRAGIMGRLSAVNACMMGAATLGSGYLYERIGAMTFPAMAVVALAGLALLAITFRLGRRAALDSPPLHAIPVHAAGHPDGAP